MFAHIHTLVQDVKQILAVIINHALTTVYVQHLQYCLTLPAHVQMVIQEQDVKSHPIRAVRRHVLMELVKTR